VAEGSRREPNLEVVRRTPLATARTLPWCSVIRVTIRSASPRRMVRSTTPRSRNWVIVRAGTPAGAVASRGHILVARNVASGTGSGRLNLGAGRPDRRPLIRLPAPIMTRSNGG